MSRERELWAVLDHLNIAPFCGYAEDKTRFGLFGALISPVRHECFCGYHLMIMQWYENGDAHQFLRAHGKEMDVIARSRLVSTFRATIL
jgi:ABC-type antimicrobial peptide transport system permease subunit